MRSLEDMSFYRERPRDLLVGSRLGSRLAGTGYVHDKTPMSTSNRFTPLLLVASLPACGGPGVTTSALEGGFGPLASAVWMRTHYSAGDYEVLVLTNVSGVCQKFRTQADALAAFTAARDAEPPEEATCATLTDPFLGAVDAVAALFPSEAHYLALDCGFSPGPHEIGDDAFGELQTYSGLAVSALEEDWDPASTLDAHCGLPEDPSAYVFPEPETAWAIESGTIRFASVTDASLDGSFEGELASDGGAISARFLADLCEDEAEE